MVRTLITGAAGFTGRFLAPLLSERGHEVHGIVHHPEASPIDGVRHVHEADLADLAKLRSIVGEVRPEYVVHLAAIAFVAHSDVDQMYRSNVLGTRQLFEALAKLEDAPRTVLMASSANVSGNSRGGIIHEATPLAPANDYGVTKAAMELVASLYRSRLPIVVARPFNYTGRGQSVDFIIPKIVDHVRRGAEVIELGNLDVARDFSDVRTVVDAYARLLETPAAIGETYNVCSGRAVSLSEILRLVGELSGQNLDVRVNPDFVRANEVRTLSGSAAKLEAAIGPLNSFPLDETLRWMLRD